MKFLDKLILTPDNINNIGLYGITNEFFCAYISKLKRTYNKDILILTSSLFEANTIFNSLEKYDNTALLFPMDEFITSESIAISPELKTIRLDTLNKLNSEKSHILICHLESYLRYLPSKKTYLNNVIKINIGNTYSRDKLIGDLNNIGYKKETVVTNTGEYGIRGFIIDVFPINNEYPIRIEFFDDEIESIRMFNPETQKSVSNIDRIEIYPNTEFLLNDYKDLDIVETNQKWLPKYNNNVVSIAEYLKEPIIVLKDISQINTVNHKLIEDMFEYKRLKDDNYNGSYMHEFDLKFLKNIIYYNTIDNYFNNVSKVYDYEVKSVPKFSENVELINEYIRKQLYNNKTIIIAINNRQIKSFVKYLDSPYVITEENDVFDNKVNIINFSMTEGFIYGRYVFLSENELFTKKEIKTYKSKYKYSSKIKSISSLEIGDYVVHITNGIGIYNGIKTLTQNNLKKDYLEILYAGNDKLYIPVEKIELIGKFTGKEGMSPKINKLGSSEWEKTKLRVRNKVSNIAKQLLELYAKREMQKGFAFSKDNELQTMFENEFEYVETKDQLTSIDAIKKDMESIKPMDRLLCGDVGYGKTEVAFRAIFKAVNNSKQVLYLCPTTILSTQQYENAKIRFKNYPVKIALLNRFTTEKEKNNIIEELKNGTLDVLFGTHRILSSDIKPKNLGLLIVDEEQRFGVTHKEKIKSYKENVDVLTLTATPIPRTLQMSLSGLRSLSLIETPPVDRYPIQTYVIEENKALVRDAIYKELARNGQIYILYNNVARIEAKLHELESLVPEARIVYAHGQLNKVELEDRMNAFINHKYDILLCTTIIETGIDITNANTLIIYNADHFGLSQLYQIRGRVGRSNKIAYAYLMYSKDKLLSDTAIKRLNAIKEFTELGSGFAIASRDLAIRGAGDILGSEQAGFIDSIGIDLYLKILNQEVAKLKGIEVEENETSTRTHNLINVETHISDNYVSDEELKIEIHKMINSITDYNNLLEVKEELEDRFGKVSDNILIYMYEEWFEALANKLKINRVIMKKNVIELYIEKEVSEQIDGEQLFLKSFEISRNFTFEYKNETIKISLSLQNLEKHYLYYLTKLLSNIKLKND